MPKQRTRVRRKASPLDLTDHDVTETEEVGVIRPPARRTRVRKQTQVSELATDLHPVSESATPTADQIAASMIAQLKGAGLQLTNANGQQVSNDSLATVFVPPIATTSVISSTSVTSCIPSTLPRSSLQPQMSGSLIPPISTDPHLLNYRPVISGAEEVQTLGIDTSAIGNTAMYLIKNTLPLGFNVSDKVKKEIWTDNYVDLIALLPNFNDEDDDDVLFKTRAVKISTNSKPRHFLSIHQWTAAFDIFMSLYYIKYPDSILSLIKYAYNVRAMSKQFGFNIARSYDETFRRVRKMMRFDWAVVNDDLWRTAFYENSSSQTSTINRTGKHVGSSPFPKRAQQQHNPFPIGYCWAYCKTGGCSNITFCRLKHQCVQCAKKHATVTCREWIANNGKSANTSKSKPAGTFS